MQALYSENIYDSFQILRPINFVHVVHQIGGDLWWVLIEYTCYDHFPNIGGTVLGNAGESMSTREEQKRSSRLSRF